MDGYIKGVSDTMGFLRDYIFRNEIYGIENIEQLIFDFNDETILSLVNEYKENTHIEVGDEIVFKHEAVDDKYVGVVLFTCSEPEMFDVYSPSFGYCHSVDLSYWRKTGKRYNISSMFEEMEKAEGLK